jgi:DNA modification methylase
VELNRIIQGDCLEVLKTFPDNFFDSYISDVPYGLGPKDPTPEQILAYLNGEPLDTGDFMGKRWAIPSVQVWQQAYRVLKPGAHVLAFGGTRTFDLISIGLRFAGFENRDTIAENHPALQWVYGSGMPKSTNVAMAIDKKLGHEFDSKTWEPISDEAKAVAHLGSGLKPSWEPILVFRKPFKGSLMGNIQEHGTGGLNIDGTRVKHSSPEDLAEHKKSVEQTKAKGGVRGDSWKNSSDLSGANDVNEGGRWPANLLLSHLQYGEIWRIRKDISFEECKQVLTYYGFEQALQALWVSDLGGTLDSEDADLLLKEVCWSLGQPESQRQEEGRVGISDMPAVRGIFRGDSRLGAEREEKVLLQDVPQQGQLRKSESPRKTSHQGRTGEDVRSSIWAVLEGEILSVEGWVLSDQARLCVRHGGHPALSAESPSPSDAGWCKEAEVHSPPQSRSRRENRKAPDEVRSRASHQRSEGRQPTRESGSGASGGTQPGASGHGETSSNTGGSKPLFEGGELSFEVSLGGIPDRLRHLFQFDRVLGCLPEGSCAPGCPIAELDTQSGNRPSTLTGRADPSKSHGHPGTEFNPNSTFLGERTHHSAVYADSGGASRFFAQFQEDLGAPFIYTAKANRMAASGGAFKVKHPTLKPLKLMQYLVRLVTPRGGVVLDSYCGSGSTCHAALLEGCSYIGIELGLEGEYDEAVARMAAVTEAIEDDRAEQEMAAAALGGFDDDDDGPVLPD